MLKVLQGRLQQYMNWELPDFQAGFRKGRGTRGQIANIYWIIKKAREFQKTSSLVAQIVKASACNAGDLGSIPGSGSSPGEGNGNPLQCSRLGESYGQRSLVGYSPWGHKEWDTTEWLHFYLKDIQYSTKQKRKWEEHRSGLGLVCTFYYKAT